MLKMHRSILAGVLLLGLSLSPTSSRAESPIYADTFADSPAGLMACVAFVDDLQRGYCIIAYAVGDSGTTRVVAEARDGLFRTGISDQTIPSSAFAVTTVPRLTLTFSGSVPGLGDVHLSAITQFTGGKHGTNEGCIGHPFHTEFAARADVVFSVLRTEGTVGGRQVRGGSGCDSFFTDDTTGVWRMALGA